MTVEIGHSSEGYRVVMLSTRELMDASVHPSDVEQALPLAEIAARAAWREGHGYEPFPKCSYMTKRVGDTWRFAFIPN